VAVCLIGLLGASAWGSTNNADHQLKVFDIQRYGQEVDQFQGVSIDWKDEISTSAPLDAFGTFWSDMFNCTSSACADASSSLTTTSHVDVNSLTGLNHGADMDFFYGHNISIQQWNHEAEAFELWMPYDSSTGKPVFGVTNLWGYICTTGTACTAARQSTLDWTNWGTSQIPYYYHGKNTAFNQTGIQDATITHPYSVFYAYNPLTSMITNQDYVPGTWLTENSQNTGAPPDSHVDQLGNGDAEFIIANGCQAVPAAGYTNHTPGNSVTISSQARDEWKPSWRGLHLVVGHYIITTTDCLPNMNTFANELKAGDGVLRAYFDAHTTCSSPPNEVGEYQPSAISPRNNIVDTDRWTTQISDPSTTDEASSWFAWYNVGQ
jgi:hypothetical protein